MHEMLVIVNAEASSLINMDPTGEQNKLSSNLIQLRIKNFFSKL